MQLETGWFTSQREYVQGAVCVCVCVCVRARACVSVFVYVHICMSQVIKRSLSDLLIWGISCSRGLLCA